MKASHLCWLQLLVAVQNENATLEHAQALYRQVGAPCLRRYPQPHARASRKASRSPGRSLANMFTPAVCKLTAEGDMAHAASPCTLG